MLVVVLLGCGDDQQPASCIDGVKNGDEANIDCGGACGATCELGSHCTAADDCLFGVCTDGACAPPSEGPEPTGAVSATISPDGGALEAVTDERVRVSLVFPPGAVTAPVDVTLSPRTPTSRSWIEIDLDPPGTVFAVPVSIQVELPPQVPAAADGVIAYGGSTPALHLATQVMAHELTADSIVLGVPALPEGYTARPFIDPATVLLSLPISLRARVALARQYLVLLRSTNRYGHALQLVGAFSSIAQLRGDPEFESLVQPLVDEALPIACEGLTDAAIQLESSNPRCPSEFRRFARPALNWAAVMSKLEALQDMQVCAAATRQGDGFARYELALGASGQRTEDNMLADHGAYIRCECDETPQEEWSGVQRIQCPLVANRTVPLGAFPLELPAPFDEAGEWDLAMDSIDRASIEVVKTSLVDLASGASLLQEVIVDPLIAMIRGMSYAACLRDGHAENVGKLLRVVPGRAELIEDAQYCASPLRVDPLAADAMTSVGDAVTLGAAAEPGAQMRTAEVGVDATGWLRLSGAVAALRCPGATESEPDELVAVVRTSNGDVEVARRVAGAQGLLMPPLELEIGELRTAAGLSAGDSTDVRLDIVRETTACDGLFGASEVTLFELRLGERTLVHLKLDDPAGSVAMDSSGNGHHAALSGGPTFQAGQCGGALAFASTGQMGTIPDNDAFDLTGEYTIAAWINYADNDTGHYIASNLDAASGGWGFLLVESSVTPGPGLLRFAMFGTDGCTVTGDAVPTGSWHHVAVTGASGSPFTLYIDGIPSASSAVSCTIPSSVSPLYIGNHPDATGAGLTGQLDDFRIYTRRLSAAELGVLASPTCGM